MKHEPVAAKWPNLAEYLRLWSHPTPAAAEGDPDAPVCRWCRMEGRASVGKTRHAGVYFCARHDMPPEVAP